MAKRSNDYYDSENKVQYVPQSWICPKCKKKAEVLNAIEVVHRCPSNKSQLTDFKRYDNEKK